MIRFQDWSYNDWHHEYCKIPPLHQENFSKEDKKTWRCYSLTKFVDDDGELTHLIEVLWNTLPNEKEKRLYRKGGWWQSNTINYYSLLKQEWLRGFARKDFVERQLKPRLEKSLEIQKDISTASIRRSRFNFVCFHPDARLQGFVLHHQGREDCHPYKDKLVQLNLLDCEEEESWLVGTADDPETLLKPLTCNEHAIVHTNPHFIDIIRFFGGSTDYEKGF